MAGTIVIFFLNDKKLSSNMNQISEYINDSNQNIHSYDKMNKIIVNLGSKKYKTKKTTHANLDVYIIIY